VYAIASPTALTLTHYLASNINSLLSILLFSSIDWMILITIYLLVKVIFILFQSVKWANEVAMNCKFDISKRSKKVKEEEKKWAECAIYKGGGTQLKERASLIQFFQFQYSSQSKRKSSTFLLLQCRLNPLFYFNQYTFKYLTLSFQATLRFCVFPRGESKLSLNKHVWRV